MIKRNITCPNQLVLILTTIEQQIHARTHGVVYYLKMTKMKSWKIVKSYQEAPERADFKSGKIKSYVWMVCARLLVSGHSVMFFLT